VEVWEDRFFFWVLEERWDKGWMLFKENAGAEVLK
jgi:hypothetical protein